MIKEALKALETGHLAEIGLIAFVVAFVLILIRVVLMSKAERETLKHLPLDDGPADESSHDVNSQV